MNCWFCKSTLHQNWIQRDGLLRGRDEQEGGPFRIYTCPDCRRENRVETISSHRFYTSPARDIGLVDWLVGWIEPLAPTDFLRLQEWHHQFGEERRMLFEEAGKNTYSGSHLRQWLSKRPTSIPGGSSGTRKEPHTSSQEQHKSFPTKSKPISNHPLHTLGLEISATPDQIRKRFKELVKKYHPDKHKTMTGESLELASTKLKSLIKAFEDLERKGRV